jgi:hypothetical protein
VHAATPSAWSATSEAPSLTTSSPLRRLPGSRQSILPCAPQFRPQLTRQARWAEMRPWESREWATHSLPVRSPSAQKARRARTRRVTEGTAETGEQVPPSRVVRDQRGKRLRRGDGTGKIAPLGLMTVRSIGTALSCRTSAYPDDSPNRRASPGGERRNLCGNFAKRLEGSLKLVFAVSQAREENLVRPGRNRDAAF